MSMEGAMKRLGILIFIIVLAASAAAGAANNPELKLENPVVAAYESLADYKLAVSNGLVETLAVPDSVLVSVTVDVTPTWTEEIKNARVDAKDIKLVTPDGGEILMIGQFERYGQFKMQDWGYSDYRRNDWKEKKSVKTYNAVFAVPKAVKSGRLQFGPAAIGNHYSRSQGRGTRPQGFGQSGY